MNHYFDFDQSEASLVVTLDNAESCEGVGWQTPGQCCDGHKNSLKQCSALLLSWCHVRGLTNDHMGGAEPPLGLVTGEHCSALARM